MSQFNFSETFFYNATTALTFGAHKDEVSKELYRFAYAVGLIFAPLSMTLGAGVKTLFDYFNRSELSINELEELKSNIQQLDKEKLILGAVVLSTSDEYKPQNYHARKLIQGISVVLNDREEKEKLMSKKKSALSSLRNNDDNDTPISLNQFDIIAIEENHKSWQAKAIKTLLLDFLNAVINIGRVQQQYIQKVFDPEQCTETPVAFY